jgi:VCBS repeat-containing protein
MRSMTFQIDDQSTGSAIPAVLVTITENDDGTVSFTLTVVGSYTGDLRGFFFDIADENLIDTLAVTSASAGLTEFRQANDTVGDLGDGSNMDGLRGSDGGYDAGIEIGTAGIGSDDYRSFSFTLASSAGALTLEDFANVDFGVRLTSVGLVDGSRNGSAKLLEHTSSAIDAQDVLDSVDEDAPTPATGNVFGDEPHPADRVIAVTHSTNVGEVGVEIRGTYGTLLLNCDGSYIYRLDNTNPTVQALAVGEVLADPEIFTYTARRSDEATSSSTDSAELKITIVGTNDDVLITGADATGHVAEDADATADAADALSASGAVSFADVDLSDGHSATFSASASNTPALGTFALEPVDETPNASGGSVRWSYTLDNAAAQSLAADDTVTETYTVTVDDGHGSTAAQDVTVTIHGTNDRPDAADDVATPAEDSGSGILRVAVIGTANSSVADAAAQLEDSSVFLIDADAIPMSRHFSAAQWTAALADYDAVVVGSSGFADAAEFQSSQLFPALRSFVDSGGGVVTTGWFTFDLNNMYGALYSSAADADYISPVARNAYTWSTFGTTISVSDPAHPITQGISSYVVNTGNHEQTTAVDATATRLASGPAVFGAVNTTAIAYDEVGEGLTAYVGGLYLANPFYGNVPLRSGVLDQILEQAVAWVANGQSPRLTEDSTFTIAAEALLANDADIDAGDTLSILSVSTAGLLGASVSLDSNGDVVYDPVSALQYLGAGETASDTFTYTVTDNHGATDSATVTLTVTGRNDAPDITGGTTTGLVYEDGAARVARGQLAAFDVDHNAAVSWSTVGAPAFGFATVDGAGRWTYTLDNTRFATQQLKQDPNQVATDTFLVRATDEHGAFDTQTVTVSVVGTNDRPNLPPFTLALSVSEDGGSGFTQTSAFDVDNGSVLHWSLNRGSTFGYFSDYEFKADSFSISRNGVQIFHDEFDAGGPPPSAPNFSNDTPANYTTTGLLVEVVEVEELDGKLVMRGDNAFAFRGTGNNALIVGNEAILATNVDPANTVNGLKKNHQFVVESVFDLIEPELGRQQYGIQLTDGVGQLADDLVALVVRRDANDGQLYVRLSDNNAVLDVSEAVASELLVPGSADQIRLRLSHEADSGNVSASYELLEKNADDTVTVIGDGNLGSVGIFGTDTAFAGDDNNWIRAGLIANAFDADEFAQTLAGNYGTLTVSALPSPPTPFVTSVAQLTYTPDNANPAVQALAQGESVVDSFFVRTVDQFGMSTPQRVDVTVNGVNDTPDITGGVTTGLVYEDAGARAASGQLSAFDVDHNAVVSWTTVGTPFYGSATINPNTGQWTYTVDNGRFQTQQLAQGQIVTDTFVVRATDEHGAFDAQSEQLVTVTVVGTNDRPNLPPTPLLLSIFEDGGSGFTQTSAFDVDNGSVLHWSLNRGSALGYFSDYEFKADSFSISRNGVQIFHDAFDAGGPPPSAPNFSNNTVANYTTTGLLVEVDGKLVMRGDNAFAFRGTGNNALIVGNEALLATNVDPANTVNGLKKNHQFVVESVFDLIEPELGRQQYGIQLTDGVGRLADDLVVLVVRRDPNDGQLYVRLSNNSAVLDASELVSSELLVPGSADQIRLRLSHEADSGNVSAFYELLDDGIVVGGGSLGEVGIFGTDTAFSGDDENWIRAGLIANAFDADEFAQTLAGTYGTLTVNNIGQLNYTPNAAAQTLGQGDVVVDGFFVRAVDQFGMSTAQRVDVTVNGWNDAPTAVNDFVAGQVSEDSKTVINALGNDFDIDAGDHFRVATHDVFSFYGARITLNADGTFEYDPTNAPLLQDLRDGEVLADTFGYTLTDEIAFSDRATVQVTVHGVSDDNSAPVAIPDDNNNDLVAEAGVTFTGFPFAGDPTASGNVLANDTDRDAGDELRVVALNGVQLPAGGSLTLTLTYGSLRINADGSWTYTLDNLDPDTNALRQVQPVFAEPVFEHVSYTVADDDGATDTEVLSIRISGTNDAPVAVPDSNAVTEDVVLTAVGNVLTNDSDPEGNQLQVFSSGAIPGAYGTLTLNQDGSYVYQLNPALANFLDAGQVVHDIFENRYVVAEGFGGFAQTFATLLDIAVTGTDEAPSFADGAVFEDGGRKASGEVVTTSVDLNAAPVWSIVGAGPMTQIADYRYLIDNLRIVRNGAQFFNDDFGNGLPPPSAPINANPGYFTSGTFQETGGRVIMDGSFAGAAGSGFVGHFATLNTDISTSTTQGLKRSHSFTVEARFELVLPTEALQTYGVRLTDAGTPGGGDDIVEISVRRLADGSFAVLLRETDVVGGVPNILGTIPLVRAPGDQLIVLRLEHAADSDIVTASFDILNGGAISQSHTFNEVGAVGHIFGNGETFTRAQIVGLSPSHAQNGVYGTLSVESDGDWTYALNNGIANVQALAQAERVTDTFTVQVTDANGASETHTVALDVFGTNDTPTPSLAPNSVFFGGGVNGAYVVEDGLPQTTQGTTFVSDIDHGPRAHFSVTANAVPGPVTPYSSDYLFRIDELKIIKDGTVNTLDTFNDGAAPGTTNGGDYFVTGAFTEAGGRAILDGHRAGAISGTATSDLVVGNVVLLNTNQRAEDPQRGFKTVHDFMAEARFDFDANFMPAAGQGFGIAFTDRAGGEIPPNQVGDDSINLLVLRDQTGNVVVQFDERDAVSDSISVIGSMTLPSVPLGSQIVLRLEHDTADLGRLEASFDVLDGGGTLLQTGAFAEAAHREDRIFGLETPDDPSDDEGWTRFQFLAFGRDTAGTTAQGAFGTLSIAEDGDWTYALNNNLAQGLNQGQIAMDSFNIRAVDAEGASNSRPLNINVIGTGDGAPAPVDAVGSPGSDVLIGSTLSDLITGNGGGDLLIGLGGRDTFDYNSINDGPDTITDFTPGVGGDVLDIRDIVQGYIPPGAPIPPDTLPYQVVPFSFVQLQTFQSAGGVPNTTVAVNADGLGVDYVPVATLQGVGGLLLEEMIANGNLVLA